MKQIDLNVSRIGMAVSHLVIRFIFSDGLLPSFETFKLYVGDMSEFQFDRRRKNKKGWILQHLKSVKIERNNTPWSGLGDSDQVMPSFILMLSCIFGLNLRGQTVKSIIPEVVCSTYVDEHNRRREAVVELDGYCLSLTELNKIEHKVI